MPFAIEVNVPKFTMTMNASNAISFWQNRRVLVTGGAGFIGINASKRFILDGWDVTIVDNLSRMGGPDNLEWLKSCGDYHFKKMDIRDYQSIKGLFQQERFDVILHLAAQVAVTTSVSDPRTDFEINAFGTFNLLEASRQFNPGAFFIYSSTNKVYGGMKDIRIIERNSRYEYANLPNGVNENTPIDLYSPYGCSKGAADQYVIDYSRIYGIQTVVFRQSCIYGPRQFGVEDQGWVAWFIIAAVLGKKITIYGDGKQIRDVLHVGDLIEAFMKAIEARETVSGKAFNIGGGPKNTLSLLELLELLQDRLKRPVTFSFDGWRPGDQKVFVSEITKAGEALQWTPSINAKNGVNNLIEWVQENKALFS